MKNMSISFYLLIHYSKEEVETKWKTSENSAGRSSNAAEAAACKLTRFTFAISQSSARIFTYRMNKCVKFPIPGHHMLFNLKNTLDVHVNIQSINMLLCHVLYETQHTGF